MPSEASPKAAAQPSAGLLTLAAGHACAFFLQTLGCLPPRVTIKLLRPFLRLYPLIRPGQTARLRACFTASPFQGRLHPAGYYAMRLRLLMSGLSAHVDPSAVEDARGDAIGAAEGGEIYLAAQTSNRPIALIGLHAGPWEELHRLPPAHAGRPFLILTAPAFSPPLTAFMARGREAEGKNILWNGRGGKQGLAAGILAVESRRGILALMADQHPNPGETEWITLWDRIRTPYPARLLRLLAAKDFLLLPVSAKLEADGSVRLRFHPLWNIPRESGINVDQWLERKVRDFLETAIAAAPEQWNWSYPKIRPG